MPDQFDEWPSAVRENDFPTYRPRRMGFVDHWRINEWAIKAYGVQHREPLGGEPLLQSDLIAAAREHVSTLLPLTKEEGEFYKTGFTILHAGVMANWLLFQWWTHGDVWCQFLSRSDIGTPLTFERSTSPVRACVYETAIIWFEQQSWIRNVLNGSADRRAYLQDAMRDEYC